MLVINYLKTDAIVLRTYEYSETSYVLSLLTRAQGKLNALAKGGRRPRGVFGGEIDLLAEGQAVLFLAHQAASLHLCTEFCCRARRLGLRSSLDRSSAACYAAELAAAASPEGDSQPQLYDLLAHTLDGLETGDVAAVIAFFQVHLLRLTGLLPDLAACTGCGKRIGTQGALYSFQKAGVICPGCIRDDKEEQERGRSGEGTMAMRVSGATISLIKLALAGKLALDRTRVPSRLAIEAVGFLGRVISAAFEHDSLALRPMLAAMRRR